MRMIAKGSYGGLLLSTLLWSAMGRSEPKAGVPRSAAATTTLHTGVAPLPSTTQSATSVEGLAPLLAAFSILPPEHSAQEYKRALTELLKKVHAIDASDRESRRKAARAARLLAVGLWSTRKLSTENAVILFGTLVSFFISDITLDPTLKGTPDALSLCVELRPLLEHACRSHYCIAPDHSQVDSLSSAETQYSVNCTAVKCTDFVGTCTEEDKQQYVALQESTDELFAAQAALTVLGDIAAPIQIKQAETTIARWAERLALAESKSMQTEFSSALAAANPLAGDARRKLSEAIKTSLEDKSREVDLDPHFEEALGRMRSSCRVASKTGLPADFNKCAYTGGTAKILMFRDAE